MDFSEAALGRKPHDPERFAAVPLHDAMASEPLPEDCPPPPGFIVEPGYNLTLPTCTVVGLLNCARLWTIKQHKFDLAYELPRLLTFYAAVAGCEPTTAAIAATEGLRLLDVLEYAQANGFQINTQDVLVPLFRRIEVADMTSMRQAIATTGSVYPGYDLTPADMNSPWTGNVAIPVYGGHCAPGIGYTSAGFTDATWGMEQPCDDAWVLSRIQEAYRIEWTMAAA
jgi:hypothetical protein